MKKEEKADVQNVDDTLHIDETRLDEEWMRQPTLFSKYARQAADAKMDLDEARSSCDVIKATLTNSAYVSPEKFGMPKATDARVASVVIVQGAYQQAHKKVIECRHASDIVSAMVSALDHKKQALECLVKLHGQDYFSSPRAEKTNVGAVQEMEKRHIRRKGKKGDRE